MELAELAHWTPVRFDFSGPLPTVDWADLSGEHFTDPFFDQTVSRWLTGPNVRPLVRTGLEALAALDSRPSLEPAGMIFHLSRCGSTLASSLMQTVPGVVVLSEPAPLNALLRLDPSRVDQASLVQLVRLLVRALGRLRHADERQLVLKCTSWNIRRQAVLAEAFPDTPWIWIQREPVSVLASLLAEPPGWLGLQSRPHASARLFGFDPLAVPAMPRAEFAARALGAMMEAAAGTSGRSLLVDYAELPAAVWQCMTSHFALQADTSVVERMIERSRFYSKGPSRVFVGDAPDRRRVTDEIRIAAARFAEPAYRALAARRARGAN